MNSDLVQRLLFAETSFLDALQNGPQMLASYRESFSALPTALSTAMTTGGASNETLSLAHSVASRILNIASCYLHVKHKEADFSAQLRADCDAMLHQMDALNLNAHPESSRSGSSPDAHSPPLPAIPVLDAGHSPAPLDLNANPGSLQPDNSNHARCSRSHPSTPISNAEGLPPPFIVAARQWLLENLHNPYPSAEVKAQMAATSSYNVSSINSWFINTRRRIGWTTLCREHFSNRRADMIDAAYRALVEEDPQRALSPELRHSFVAMRVAVEDLYSSTLTRSTFAGDLDTVVNAMTKQNGEFAEVRKYRQVKQANLTKVVQDSYPSPDTSVTSITSSPVSILSDSLTVGSEEDDDVAPPVIAGSKRRRSSVEPVDNPSSTASRPIKRLRASATSQTCLPSPPSSTDGIDETSHHSSPVLPHVHSTLPETNRVLPSHADATGIPNYGSMAAPLQSVSDPSPHSNMENELSIDDWFNANFDALFAIPPPVDATEPDFTTGWEVELFKDYSIPENPNCPPAPAGMPVPSDSSDLESLLHSIGSDASVTPAISLPQSVVTGTSYSTSLDSSICDASQTDVDWTSFLNDTELYPPTTYSTFPQCPTDSQLLPEIDLSMLQFPQVVPVVDPQGDPASREAKLQQLHAMQEAVWRMEQELRSEGVVM